MTDDEINLKAQGSVVAAISLLSAETTKRGRVPDLVYVVHLAASTADVLVTRLAPAMPLDPGQTRALVAALLSVSLGGMVGVANTTVEEAFARTLRELLPRAPEGPPA